MEKNLGRQRAVSTAQQAIEATNDSEISLEQAWLQYDIQDWLKFRGGGVLVPLGRFNLNHDDNRWDLPRRSLVDRGVPVLPVPAAWDELGVGFLGDVPLGGGRAAQLPDLRGERCARSTSSSSRSRADPTSRPGEFEIEVELKPSNGTFGKDVKNAKAFTGRARREPDARTRDRRLGVLRAVHAELPADGEPVGVRRRLEERLRARSSSRASTSTRTSPASGTSRPAWRTSRAIRAGGRDTRPQHRRSSSSSPTWRPASRATGSSCATTSGRTFLTKSFLGWEFDDPTAHRGGARRAGVARRAGPGGDVRRRQDRLLRHRGSASSTGSRPAWPTDRFRWSSSSSPTSTRRRTPARACRASPTSSPATWIT